MQQLSSQLGITGFAKVRYPGIMYAEGPQEAVEAFVRDVKGMQWLALRIRFVEHLDFVVTRDQNVLWVEVSKIGEVLELTRIQGRKDLFTNLGIGAPSKELKH
jgi:acylphosphatase